MVNDVKVAWIAEILKVDDGAVGGVPTTGKRVRAADTHTDDHILYVGLVPDQFLHLLRQDICPLQNGALGGGDLDLCWLASEL